MSYTPIYTTKNNIKLKLASRLNINTANTTIVDEFFPGVNTRPAQNLVDDNLLDLILEEKESFLNMVLDQAYELPLKNSHPILREIIDNWVIAELLKVYYHGVGLSNVSSDISQTATDLNARANYLLATIMIGRDIYLPIPMPDDRPIKRPIPFILKGEIQKPPQTLVINESIIMGALTRNSSAEMGIDWGYETPMLSDNLNRQSRARGASRPR